MSTDPTDEAPTVVFPGGNGGYYENPYGFNQGIDEINIIVVAEIDDDEQLQTKGGKMSKINQNSKNIKQLQKELQPRMRQQNMFNVQLISGNGGITKKLYLLLYNATYYSYDWYYIYSLIEKDPRCFEEYCAQTLKLHEKLMQVEKVEKIREKNSLYLMTTMKNIIENMSNFHKDMQKKNEEGISNGQLTQKYLLDQEKNFPFPAGGNQAFFCQLIKKLKVQTLIIDFLKLIMKVCNFIGDSPNRGLQMFEEKIRSYMQGLQPSYKPNDDNELFFDYFKELMNQSKILQRFELMKLQIQSLYSLLSSLDICDSLALSNDEQLLNSQQIDKKRIGGHQSTKDILLSLTKLDTIDNRNKKIFV